MGYAKRLIPTVLTAIGLAIGTIPLIAAESVSWWTWALIVAAGVAVVIAGLMQIVSEARTGAKRFNRTTDHGRRKLQSYMARLLQSAGAVAVFTKDMTWAEDRSIAEILEGKASRNELTIVMKAETESSKRLAAMGATVYYYANLGYLSDLSTRFTIVNYGSASAEVAIGRTQSGMHTIERFRSLQDPPLYLARDMVELVKAATPEATL